VAHNSASDNVDAAANFTIVFFLMTVVGGVAFANDPGLRWIPVVTLLLMIVAYSAAIEAAVSQGVVLLTAFDLHRFDLLRGLHLELPNTPEEELRRNSKISEFLALDNRERATEGLAGFIYVHGDRPRD